MNIGEASKASGVPAKLIRYYESIGLIPVAGRTASGYRLYSPRDVHTLSFVRQARALGFSIEQIQRLLALWQDRDRESAEVKALALAHIAELEQKIKEMHAMVSTLKTLAESCHGDHRPDCPILDSMAGVSGERFQAKANAASAAPRAARDRRIRRRTNRMPGGKVLPARD